MREKFLRELYVTIFHNPGVYRSWRAWRQRVGLVPLQAVSSWLRSKPICCCGFNGLAAAAAAAAVSFERDGRDIYLKNIRVYFERASSASCKYEKTICFTMSLYNNAGSVLPINFRIPKQEIWSRLKFILDNGCTYKYEKKKKIAGRLPRFFCLFLDNLSLPFFNVSVRALQFLSCLLSQKKKKKTRTAGLF